MSHQEKQRIFDEYAKSKGIESWEVLTYSIPVEDLILFTYEACDLVKEEQQKRIAENACIEFSQEDQCFSIDKYSIINPENLIK